MRTSVIIALHNGSDHITEQLASITGNSRKPNEIVIVDDASSDDSTQIAQDHLSNYPDINLVIIRNKHNLGASISFSSGILASTGDILFLSDQDDAWSTNKIDVIYQYFKSDKDLTMIYSDGSITNKNLAPTGRTIFSTRKHFKNSSGLPRRPIEIVSNPDIKGCTMALNGNFARRVFRSTNSNVFHYWGHDHWVALFAYFTGHVSEIKEPLLLHRFHDRNTSRAERFSPFSSTIMKRYLSVVGNQPKDFLSQRYSVVLQHIAIMGVKPKQEFLDALTKLKYIANERETLRERPFIQRIREALRLRRQGAYAPFNGWFTLLRDVLLR